MKKIVPILIAAICLIQMACSQKKESSSSEDFTITGKISGIENSGILRLFNNETDIELDSCIIRNGEFSFTGKVDAPFKAVIKMYKSNGAFGALLDFYLENADYKLFAERKNFDYATLTGNSKVNAAYNEFLNSTNKYRKQMDTISALWRSGKKMSKEENEKKSQQIREANKKYIEAEKQFVLSNPDTYTTLDILWNFTESNARARETKNSDYAMQILPMTDEDIKCYYKKLSPEIQNSSKGRALYQLLFSSVFQLGDKYVEFEDTFTMDGIPFKIADLKTDYVLLDFTGVYCGWCKKFNEYMLPHYENIKDKLTIVSFYTDTKKELIVKSIKKEKINWTVVSDFKGRNSANKQRYRVEGIPDFYLLDKDRKIIKHQTGFDEEFAEYLINL